MTIKGSQLAEKANFVYCTKSTDLYFYDTFLISEIHEGVVIETSDFKDILTLIHKHFGFDTPYGLISHRINSYSVNLYDLMPIANEFGPLVANAVVAYSNMSLKTFELEKRILKFAGESFLSLDEAIEWTKQKVANSQVIGID